MRLSLAVWTGLEPATPCVTGRYSNQLNYQTNIFSNLIAAFLLFSTPLLRSASANVKQIFLPHNTPVKKIEKKFVLPLGLPTYY